MLDICTFTVAVILHTFMVTILIVSETVLLVTVCKCIYHTFFSFFHILLFLSFFCFAALVANKGI